MTKHALNLHIIRHTGWVREGARTFQENRLELVDLLDELLSSEFSKKRVGAVSITLGGQVLELEDYLEIRPDADSLVHKLVQKDCMILGPWFVLPADRLCSGEALIRNLMLGLQRTKSHGARRFVGYLGGPYGHVGQLPQIMRSFGIKDCISLISGYPQTVFTWKSPSFNELTLINALDVGTYAFSGSADSKSVKREFQSVVEQLSEGVGDEAFVMVSGSGDGTRIVPGVMALRLNARSRTVSFATESVNEALAAVESNEESKILISGEIRSASSVSARIDSKQRNHQVQGLFTNVVEPLEAWAYIAFLASDGGSPINGNWIGPARMRPLAKHGWELILQNQAVNVIGGSTSDQVHHETIMRYDQADQIGRGLAIRMLHQLSQSVNTSSPDGRNTDGAILVFNPNVNSCSHRIETTIPLNMPDASITLWDSSGTRVECLLTYVDASAESAGAEPKCSILFTASDVPALGYRTYYYVETGQVPETRSVDEETHIENDLVHVAIDVADGTLTVFDKRTGRTFSGLNKYVDGGDCGDALMFCPPLRDTQIDIAANTPLQVDRVISPTDQTMTFLQIYRVPRGLSEMRDARLPFAAQFVPVSILTSVRLRHASRVVEVEARVSNDAYDHRLRVHFSATGGFERAYVETPFYVEDIDLMDLSSTSSDTDALSLSRIQGAFTTLVGPDSGITIANRGIPEIEISKTDGMFDVAITLMRSIGWLRRTDLPGTLVKAGEMIETPGSQCIGEYEFHYAIVPHSADVVGPWNEARNFQSDFMSIPTNAHVGRLPPEGYIVRAEEREFVLTSIKLTEDGDRLLVRGFNQSKTQATVHLEPGIDVRGAKRARLDETPYGRPSLPGLDGRYVFELGPAEILTVIFDV